MKLIDLLVQELPKRGGWPEDAVTAIYFSHKKGTTFYDKDGFIPKNGIPFICMDMPGVHREEVTKEEFESALAASEGWIEWGGGECPVHESVNVDIRFEDGSEKSDVPACSFIWQHSDCHSDIIAYRLHKPDIKSRANDDRLEQDIGKLHHATISVDGRVIGGAPFNSIEDANEYSSRLLNVDPAGESDLNECIGQDVDMPVWNGEGLPPVGTICMANLANGWTDVKVAYIGDEGGWREALVFEVKSTKPAWADEFRPIRSEAERKREDAINKIQSHCHVDHRSPISAGQAIALYDAIAAGKIPGVKLSD